MTPLGKHDVHNTVIRSTQFCRALYVYIHTDKETEAGASFYLVLDLDLVIIHFTNQKIQDLPNKIL